MICYKAFNPDYTCRGYRFDKDGINITEAANCVKNGFHCAENPMDCLTYYPDFKNSIYCLVEASGDVHEDGSDSKISCTVLKVLKELTHEEYMWMCLAYMIKHPRRAQHHAVQQNKGEASGRGYVVVKGVAPTAKGKLGDILAFALTNEDGDVVDANVIIIDGEAYEPDVLYNADGEAAV